MQEERGLPGARDPYKGPHSGPHSPASMPAGPFLTQCQWTDECTRVSGLRGPFLQTRDRGTKKCKERILKPVCPRYTRSPTNSDARMWT